MYFPILSTNTSEKRKWKATRERRTALVGSQARRFTRHEPGSPGRLVRKGGEKRWQSLAGCRSTSAPVIKESRDSSGRERVGARNREIGRETKWWKVENGTREEGTVRFEHGGGPARRCSRSFLFRAAPASPPARKSERCVMFGHLRETPRRFLATALLTTSKTFSSLPSRKPSPIFPPLASNSIRDAERQISPQFFLANFSSSWSRYPRSLRNPISSNFCYRYARRDFSDCIVVRDKDGYNR